MVFIPFNDKDMAVMGNFVVAYVNKNGANKDVLLGVD